MRGENNSKKSLGRRFFPFLYYLYKSSPVAKGAGRVGVGSKRRVGAGARSCMSGLSLRGGSRVKFGRRKALGNTPRTQQEPHREEEPKVSLNTEGKGVARGLSESKVRSSVIGVSLSVLLGWGLYQWGASSRKQ